MKQEFKEFNLEEALAGKPVVTRSGNKVGQFHIFNTVNSDVLYAVVEDYPTEGKQCITYFGASNGAFYRINTEPHCLDLFMAPEKKLTNLYYDPKEHEVVSGEICDSKEEALEFCTYDKGGMKYIDTISFNVEEDNK